MHKWPQNENVGQISISVYSTSPPNKCKALKTTGLTMVLSVVSTYPPHVSIQCLLLPTSMCGLISSNVMEAP